MSPRTIPLLFLLAALSAAGCGGRPDHVIARRVSGELPRTDPVAAAWDDLPEYEAELIPQNVVAPHLAEPSVSRVRVRALHDGSWVAVRLEWEDSTDDHVVAAGRFSDACALQLPAGRDAVPSPMMGNDGAPVEILYFRASWQTEDPMEELYPNMPPTYHPPESAAEGPPREEMQRVYVPAAHAGNPTVVRVGDAPVALFVAEGFGTLSPPDHPVEANGAGVFRDGHWYVVLSRPIGDAATSPIAPGQRSSVAFAVWNGSHGDVGSRKMRSNWVALEMVGGS